ncbi:DUF2156 domain-containing protein [Dissulfurirhabdus thermomarina]|uniref:DUF2156 domain-containing protein n=1 Tax=Dissulfurirhabdus thermomarina TaxID=1765737 RepID=A0A6N9TT58_DISTH|nr:phosphatidylglycerol lysyltransferase domain-containing protein [Dissulfurirhabdus thermomarina]NDY43580.1 DUF2156 domain-containing protein [Dissulfurirhabdus thermomarina]NMX24289.1 DUF2156 domain-containing protein [Dissulfurirhabdus thermomarina]
MIPSFPRFKALELADAAEVTEALRAAPPVTSELTFTNLFMWRRRYRFRLSRMGSAVAVFADPATGGSAFFLPPLGPGATAAAVRELFDWMAAEGFAPLMRRVSKAWAEELGLGPGTGFRVEETREDADYVYRVADLAALRGRRLRKKKNHLNHFLARVDFAFELLDAERAAECLELEAYWCRFRECAGHEDLRAEDEAVAEALRHWSDLPLRGGLVRIGGRVAAFSFGEPLNPETAVVHVEKADPEVRGLYVAVNHLCCRQVWREFRYVNREQDLGEPGLRKAKLSWDPAFLVEKVAVRPAAGAVGPGPPATEPWRNRL